MISEVSPLPQMYVIFPCVIINDVRTGVRFLFFALFSVVSPFICVHHLNDPPSPQVGKTSAFIGPLVSSAIITASGDNDNMPFAFLFTLCVLWIGEVRDS